MNGACSLAVVAGFLWSWYGCTFRCLYDIRIYNFKHLPGLKYLKSSLWVEMTGILLTFLTKEVVVLLPALYKNGARRREHKKQHNCRPVRRVLA